MSVGPLHIEGDSIIFIEEEHSSFDSWKTAIDRIAMLSPQFIVGSHGDIGDQTLIDIWDSLISEISATLSEYRSLGFSKSKAVRELTLLLNQKFPEWRNDRRRMAAAVESAYR
jgi:hypothetical protein